MESEDVLQEEPLELDASLVQEQVEASVDYFDLDEYAGEVETHYWVPNKSNPQKKIRLDLKIQALTGTQVNVIHKKALRAQNAAVESTYLQQRIIQHTMPREVYRTREKISNVSELDFDSPEKADEKRDEYDNKIKSLLADWKREHDEMKAELEKLLAWPSFYETLRAEYFSVVIEDHSIAWKGRKIDFSKPMTDNEPPDKFVGLLKDYIDEVCRRGKVTKLNGKRR